MPLLLRPVAGFQFLGMPQKGASRPHRAAFTQHGLNLFLVRNVLSQAILGRQHCRFFAEAKPRLSAKSCRDLFFFAAPRKVQCITIDPPYASVDLIRLHSNWSTTAAIKVRGRASMDENFTREPRGQVGPKPFANLEDGSSTVLKHISFATVSTFCTRFAQEYNSVLFSSQSAMKTA